MNHVSSTLVAITLSLALASAAHALTEVQVPFDERGRLTVLDGRLARRLGVLADEYPGLVEARLMRGEDGGYTLEVLQQRQGEVTRVRKPLDDAAVATLRALVQARITQAAPEAGIDQAGRTLALSGDAALGLGFYGWAIPVALDFQDQQAVFGSYLMTAGLSYFVPLLITRTSTVTYAMANAGFYGQTRGIVNGVLIANASTSEGHSDRNRAAVTGALVGSISEGVAGYVWAGSTRMTTGHAATLVTGGDFGYLFGLTGGQLAGAYETDRLDRTWVFAGVGGHVAGLALAHALANHRDYSYGDAGVMRVGGLVGAGTGLAIAHQLTDPSDRVLAAAAASGAVAGLAIGDRLVDGAQFTASQNVLTHLGATAGGLFGLGMGILITSERNDNKAAALTTALGAIGGYAISVGQFSRDARDAVSAWPAAGHEEPSFASHLELGLEPRVIRTATGSQVSPHVTVRATW